MTETLTCMNLREYVNDPGRQGRIDRRRGVINGVKILGVTSRNNRRYPLETLREAISLYQNAKVNLNHPDGNPTEPRRYQDRFGLVKNVRVVESDGLFADFHFNPKHRYAEQLLWDAENAPENVGFSHNIEAEVVQESGVTVVRKITAVRSVDLVADPATTLGLFESCEATPVCSRSCLAKAELEKTDNDGGQSAQRFVLAERFCKKLVDLLVKKESLPVELFSEIFVQSLFESCETPLLEKMLADRIRLAETWLGVGSPASPPLSREQESADKSPDNVKIFLELICQ